MAKKIACVICDDKFPVEELTFNSAEHGLNVCSDCATPAIEMAVENETQRLIAKGIDAALAKKKASKKDLAEKTVKIIRDVLAADENEDDVDGDDTGDVDIDETKPVKESDKKPEKDNKKADKASGPSLEELRATLKELKAELKTAKKPEKVQTKIDETITAIKAEKKRLANGGGKVSTGKPDKVKPAKTESKTSTPDEDTETLTLEIEAAQIQRIIGKAIKQAKEELANTKIKKGVDPAEVFAELATDAFHTGLDVFTRRISKLAAESGISIKAAIKKAIKDI